MPGLVPGIHTRRCAAMVSKDSFNVFIAVYMMANGKHGTIYTGVTSKLPSRVYDHREDLVEGFTKRYGLSSTGLSVRRRSRNIRAPGRRI
jgi:hypothetical protein